MSPRRTRTCTARSATDAAAGSCYAGKVNVGITCYPTYGGSGIVATELGLELADARPRSPLHHLRQPHPAGSRTSPRIHYHEVEVSNYPLFQYPPYCLALASRMAEVAEAYELDLLHVHYAIPHSISAMLAQQMLAPHAPPAVHHHAARHRYHAGGHRTARTSRSPNSPSNNPTASPPSAIICGSETVEVFGVANEIRVIKNFVNCDLYQPDDAEDGRRALRARRREAADSPLQFPAGEARAGLHPHSGRGAQARAGAPADGGRRAGARSRRAPGARAEGGASTSRFWASRTTWSG